MGKDIVSENLSKLPLIFAAKAGPFKLDHFGKLPTFIEVEHQHKQNLIN